jgi:uncharacterized membrane protein YphA (DoxX/SURF4 family)
MPHTHVAAPLIQEPGLGFFVVKIFVAEMADGGGESTHAAAKRSWSIYRRKNWEASGHGASFSDDEAATGRFRVSGTFGGCREDAMSRVSESAASGWSWALLFARWVLGLTFFMAGWWKTFELGPLGHARRFFIDGYSDSWIPLWLLWAVGVAIPVVELVAGALVCLGWRRREALVALGGILVVVTYGHLLAEPLYSLQAHIFVRLTLLLFVLAAPAAWDRWSVDEWWRQRG